MSDPVVLVVGFGAFPGVPTNPSSVLAQAVNGVVVHGRRVVGREIPVSYSRGPDLTVTWAREMNAEVVVGIGVAVGRDVVTVEGTGRCDINPDRVDTDGIIPSTLGPGPQRILVNAPLSRVATAVGGVIGHDAGCYVCNAWIYRVVQDLADTATVAFLHIPSKGLDDARLLSVLAALCGSTEEVV